VGWKDHSLRKALPGYPYYFNGVIDEIRIYNGALSEDEVLRLNTAMGD
jgi:hypothetical protein